MTEEQIVEKLKKHEMWLNGEEGGECADFSGADLSDMDLSGVDLYGADLSKACMTRSNLSCANLYRANLSGACLCSADLSGANLKKANLEGAMFSKANIEKTLFSPEEQYRLGTILKAPITGYKKCWNGRRNGDVIVSLEIPKNAVVFCINGKECRTNRAKVIAISEGIKAFSKRDTTFSYTIGQEIEIDDFNLQYNIECASGIHFFKTREEAENY